MDRTASSTRVTEVCVSQHAFKRDAPFVSIYEDDGIVSGIDAGTVRLSVLFGGSNPEGLAKYDINLADGTVTLVGIIKR